LAQARMARTPDDEKTNPRGLAFLTERQGFKPLVRKDKCKVDEVGAIWKRLCKVAGVEDRGFYALRRTAIDQIDEIADETIADLFGCHAPKSINRKHYSNKRWGKLFKAMRKWKAKLQPMFDAAAVTVDQE
jgi:hypothetical protein